MANQAINVLSIEDNPSDARLIQALLSQARSLAWDLPRLELNWVQTLADGLARLDQGGIDVVLSDLDLPDSRAGDTFAAVHAHAPDVPIVVLTGREDEALAWRTVQAGAEDYLFKREMSGTLLAHALIYAIERQQAKGALQEAHDELERRVVERTAELEQANEQLRREVAQRKQAEEALRERSAELDRFFSSALDLLCIADTDGHFRRLNAEWERTLGYPLDELQGRRFFDLVHPDDLADTLDAVASLDAGEAILNFTNRYRCRDGSYRWIEWRSIPAGNKIYAAARDVTERKRTEIQMEAALEALRESEARYRITIHRSPIGVGVVDSAGQLTDCNDALADMVGYSRQELLRLNFADFTHPDDLEREWGMIEALWQENETEYRMEKRYLHKDGHIVWVDVAASLFKGAEKELEFGFAFVQDITERKRVENALQESESRLRAIFETAQDSIFIKDAALRYVAVNPAMEQLFGRPASDLIGRTDEDLFGEKAGAHIRQIDTRVLAGQVVAEEDTKPVHPGELRTFHVIKVPMHDESKHVVGLCGIARDVTDRKRMERRLKEREKRFRQIVENTRAGYFYIDREGCFEHVNDAWLEMHHYQSADEVLGQRFSLTQIEEDLEQAQKIVNEVLGGKSIPSGQFSRLCQDGTIGYHIYSANPVMRDEACVGLEGFLIDITEQVQAQRVLAQQEAQLRQIIDLVPHMIFAKTLDGRFLLVNQAGADFAGLTVEEMIGHLESEWVQDEQVLRMIQAEDRAVFESGQSELFSEQTLLDNHGRRHLLQTTKVPFQVVNLDEPAVLGVSVDITERKRAEQEVRRYADELKRSNRELEQFAHVVSHDLREPLRAAKSYLELVRASSQDQLDTETNDLIGYALDGTIRMQEMVRGLLDLARVHTRGKDLTPVDCETLLESTLADLGITIQTTGAQVTHDPLPTVLADKAQLAQVFQNLIGNALKFHGEEPPRVHLSARREGNEWVFSVQDNGIGIDPAQFERIFQIFQRLHTRDEYEGTGIGLALCQKIVERHGGRIWAESEPGEGSTFYFTLPNVHSVIPPILLQQQPG